MKLSPFSGKDRCLTMAVKVAENKEKKYRVKVTTNPGFCGIDAGGVQFANGVAEIGEGSLVNWFREHEGYEVTEAPEVEAAKAAKVAE